MNFINITTMLARGKVHYAFGRFYFVRRCYSFFKRNFFKITQPQLVTSKKGTIFSKIAIENAVDDLKKKAVSFGFNLSEGDVREIDQFANERKCFRSGDRKVFLPDEVKLGKLSDGHSVVLGFVQEPEQCSVIDRIKKDERLLAVCAKYLGYEPTKIETRLFWSFVTDESDATRREKWQTTGYHFDVDGFNFVYANFYITPVNRYTGAHVMMQHSHNQKPLRMLFHSAVQTDEAVIAYYGKENEITIEGPAGFGFVQDSSCYHKALAPISDNRLMLQLRIK